MTASALLTELHHAGIRVAVRGDRLRLEAKPGSLSDDLRARLAAAKPELVALLKSHQAIDDLRARLLAMADDESIDRALVHRQEADDLVTLIGLDDEALSAFLWALATRSIMDAGRVPPSYTQAVTCALCGPVKLWEGCPPSVLACPWCHVRVVG